MRRNVAGKVPLVSVIVPIYNVEKYLARCLDSIVRQTYQNLEIILVNDGSTDGSFEICQQYAKNDARIRLFTQENQGLSVARNTGLDHMNGEYVVFVDSDDYISVYFVEILLSKLLEYDVEIAISDRLEVDDTEDTADIDHVSLQDIETCIKMNRDDIFERMYESGKYVVVWGRMYHKTIFVTLRFEQGRIHEDEFIFHKIYEQVEAVCWINQALYAYRKRRDSIVRINGSYHPHPDSIDAFLERLSFFQEYGNPKFIKATEGMILQTLFCFMDQLEDVKLKELILRTEQEIYRVTGKRVFSLKLILFRLSPKIYLWLRKYYRIAKTALLKDNMV